MELKQIIAKNIAKVRRAAGLTQLQLAEKLNYSDKAVSKWESGASLPDIVVLKQIADLFGISVDSLLSENYGHEIPVLPRERVHFIISALSVMLVWLIATVVFVTLAIANVAGPLWLAFLWAVPASLVVALVMNSVWGNRRANYFIISALMWTFLGCVYITFIKYNWWLIFVCGVPGQAIISLWSTINKKRKKY